MLRLATSIALQQSSPCLPLLALRCWSSDHGSSAASTSGTEVSGRVPVEIKLRKGAKRLEVAFDDGRRFVLPAELLCVKSPSADTGRVDAHGQAKVVAGRRHVGILSVDPVGSYAVRIVFDDLHRAGIYTWDYLYDLGSHKVSHIRGHLQDLRARGLSRDPRAKPLPPPPTPPPTTQPAAATRKSPHNYQCTGSTSSTTNRQRGSWTDSPDCITQQCRRTGAEGWQQAG